MKCDTPIIITSKAKGITVPVPCGKCPNCKHRRVNEWVFRMLEQSKVSTHSHFVTLTYDTDHVPISANGFMTLCKRDVQLFFKRLRKNTGHEGIKYYAVGEYGTNNKRPHYHAIIFNVENPEDYDKAWQKGAVHVGSVSGDSIAYTIKYMDKPTPFRRFSRDDRVLEFPLMSKGLGESYMSPEVISYHKADISRMYVTRPGGHIIAMPKYYRKRIYDDDEQGRQIMIVQQAINEQDAELRKEFNDKYGNLPYTYEEFLDMRRTQRFNRFYNKQNKRNL